jgi:hypothetical protein
MIYLLVAKSTLLNLGTNNSECQILCHSLIFCLESIYSRTSDYPPGAIAHNYMSFPCLYQVKHVISVTCHSYPYKEDVMKEFAPQQGGNVE